MSQSANWYHLSGTEGLGFLVIPLSTRGRKKKPRSHKTSVQNLCSRPLGYKFPRAASGTATRVNCWTDGGSDLHGCLQGVLGLHSTGAASRHTAVFREMCTSRQIFYGVSGHILISPGKALGVERNSLWVLHTPLYPCRLSLAHFPKCVPSISQTVFD